VKAFFKLKEFRFRLELLHLVLPPAGNQAIDRLEEDARSGEVPLDEGRLSGDESPPDSFEYPSTPEELLMNRELGEPLRKAIEALPSITTAPSSSSGRSRGWRMRTLRRRWAAPPGR
jgi:DNA-directed RNA polymerase specialized sigma24 family protein